MWLGSGVPERWRNAGVDDPLGHLRQLVAALAGAHQPLEGLLGGELVGVHDEADRHADTAGPVEGDLQILNLQLGGGQRCARRGRGWVIVSGWVRSVATWTADDAVVAFGQVVPGEAGSLAAPRQVETCLLA